MFRICAFLLLLWKCKIVKCTSHSGILCMHFFFMEHTVVLCSNCTMLVHCSKHMGSFLASLPYRQQVIYYLLKIYIHINLNSSTVRSYFELVCPFSDLGEATGPIFHTQSLNRSVFMMPVDDSIPSALVEVNKPTLWNQQWLFFFLTPLIFWSLTKKKHFI